MSFKEKVAIVTAGASVIGPATVKALLAKGALVVAADTIAEALKAMEEQLKDFKESFQPLAVNVASEANVSRMIENTLSRFGGIDMLVNSAGISPKHKGKKLNLWEMPVSEWDQVMAVNIRGVFLCCHSAVPKMIERGGGAIVNLSSLAAKVGSVITGCHYVISKAGVVGLTKILAREVAEHHIRVNAVAPGRIDTPMIWDVPPEVNERYKESIPLKRLGSPEEVSDGIVFLLSDKAAYITGQVLDINGGLGIYY